MIHASRKWLKNFLALKIKKVGSPVALILGIYIKFLDEFTTVLLVILLSPSKISLSSALNTFGSDSSDDSVIFNKKVSGIAILLKPWIKCQ